MTGERRSRPVADLAAELRWNPDRAERIDALRRGIEDAIALARLREDAGLTQQELAESLAVSQANVSRIERSDVPDYRTGGRLVGLVRIIHQQHRVRVGEKHPRVMNDHRAQVLDR